MSIYKTPDIRENYTEYLYEKIRKANFNHEEIEYSHGLFRKLVSRQYMDNGRSSTKERILEQLLDTANKIDTSSVEGAISSAFIYHQIAEEWLYDFLELIRFFIDLKLYPERIQHRSSDGMKLGVLITEIESSINFENKENLIKYSRLVNQYRNSFAHDLLKKDSVEAIKKDFNKFMEHFNKMHEALEGTEEIPYGAREALLELIKNFNKWSDEFHDKHIFLLTETLEENDIQYLDEEKFEPEK
ncbi:hypothetical protein [Nostoc sp.]|uniref:hypothetical protein n=1 Tax=Nostoc sp. TaxID=1180 RepID=UPI002FF4C4BC